MNRILSYCLSIAFLAGCEKPPAPSPAVSLDTQSDLRHEHKHSHGDENRHEHQHEDYAGFHSHPHVHGHRHHDAPHGGQILSLAPLANTGSINGSERINIPPSPHVELVASFPDSIDCYFLSEASDGRWEPWKIGSDDMVLEFSAMERKHLVNCVFDEASNAYRGTLDQSIREIFITENTKLLFENIRFSTADARLSAAENLLYRNGELDRLVD